MEKPNTISGFSLVELMVVIAVISIMAAIASPSLIGWLPNARFRDASRNMLFDIQLAKLTAIKDNANVVATFLANGTGYTICVDDGGGGPPAVANNDTCEIGEQVLKAATMPTNILLSNAAPIAAVAQVPALAFLPTGIPANGVVAPVYMYNNQTNHSARLTVSVAGSIKSEKWCQTVLCP